MTGKSPRERLHKLFHRHDDASNTPPPASPTSPSSRASTSKQQQDLRKTSSSAQMYSKDSKRHSRRVSADFNNNNSNNVTNNNAPSAGAQAAAQTAAARSSRYSTADMGLPAVPHQTDLSSDFGNLTLSNADAEAARGTRPYSEDVADRNIESFGSRMSQEGSATGSAGRGSFEQRSRPHRRSVGNAQPLMPDQDRHSENVAARNGAQNDMSGYRRDVPQSLDVKKRASGDSARRADGYSTSQRDFADAHSLSRKQDVKDLRRSQDMTRANMSDLPSRRSTDQRSIGRSSLDKPLPTAPSDQRSLGSAPSIKHDSGVESELGREKGYLIKDSEKAVALSGIIDLRNTEDTTLHERWAPAVTHETITQNVHHIREEVITREIHEYHNFHRILPIVDIEVLPARHFTPVEGGYVEIAEEEVPGRAGPNAQWVIAEMVSKMMPKSTGQLPNRQFTARRFEGSDGDYKEYTGADGIKRTETWWVHPPTIETGGMETGQTYPFYFGSSNPAENGLRASLPAGNLVGVSPLMAKKQRERQGQQQQSSAGLSKGDEAPPAVPPHKSFPAEMVDSARARLTSKYVR